MQSPDMVPPGPFEQFMEWLLPQRCRCCEAWLPERSRNPHQPKHWLCNACAGELEPMQPPFCPRCAEPLQSHGPSHLPCGNCLASPPAYDFALAGYRASGSWRDLIHQFKYGRQRNLARLLSDGLIRCLEDPRLRALTQDRPCSIVACPLSPIRQWQRGFNQSHELALQLSLRSGLPFLRGALRRRHGLVNQVGLNRQQRKTNLRGKIKCTQRIENKSIILVDDVLTTGATAEACTEALLQAGAQKVVVICAARG